MLEPDHRGQCQGQLLTKEEQEPGWTDQLSGGQGMSAATDTRIRGGSGLQGRALGMPGILLVFSLLVGCDFVHKQEVGLRRDIVDEVQEVRYAPAPAEPLTLALAIQLGLQHNLETVTKQLERDIQLEAMHGTRLSMLPSFTVKGERTRRNNERASRSESHSTKLEVDEPSISADRQNNTYSLKAAWNLLDFGLSFIRARQAEEEVRIRRLRQIRSRQNLALDITEAYWKAVVAKKAAAQARELLKRASDRRKKVKQQIASKVVGEIKGLEKEQKIAQIQVRLRSEEREYAQAHVRLSKLVGFVPGTKYELAPPDLVEDLSLPKLDLKGLEQQALRNRPEIGELVHRQQIQQDEVRATILRMFPSVGTFLDRAHDDNPFLTHGTWHTISLSATHQLLSIPRRWREKRSGQKRVELTRQKRMALGIGVVTQVHLAALDLENSVVQYREMLDLYTLQKQLLSATRKHQERREAEESKVLEREAETFFAYVQYLRGYAGHMVAKARLENTLGGKEPGPQANPAVADAEPGPAPIAPPKSVESSPSPAVTAEDDPTPVPSASCADSGEEIPVAELLPSMTEMVSPVQVKQAPALERTRQPESGSGSGSPTLQKRPRKPESTVPAPAPAVQAARPEDEPAKSTAPRKRAGLQREAVRSVRVPTDAECAVYPEVMASDSSARVVPEPVVRPTAMPAGLQKEEELFEPAELMTEPGYSNSENSPVASSQPTPANRGPVPLVRVRLAQVERSAVAFSGK